MKFFLSDTSLDKYVRERSKKRLKEICRMILMMNERSSYQMSGDIDFNDEYEIVHGVCEQLMRERKQSVVK